MNLYYSPGACSIGIHVLLSEIGKPFETHRISLMDRQQHSPEYKAINPKSKVPALRRDDGSILTEYPAIAVWLARTNPEKGLLPSDAEGEARTLEAMDDIVSTMHMRGFSRIFRPGNYAPSETDHPAVQARGREIFERGLALMDEQLAGRDYGSADLSLADGALFYVEFWWADRLKLELPTNCAAHLAWMKSRPAVKQVLAAEGLAA